MHSGDRHVGAGQRALHAELPVHGMRRFQQGPRRLAAQDVGTAGGVEAEGRVRLPALELLGRERPAKTGHVVPQPGFDGGEIDLRGFVCHE